MQPTYEIRRNSDGSPDFDFFRRRAIRERRRKWRALMKRCVTIGVSAMSLSVSAKQSNGRPGLVSRAIAGGRLIVANATLGLWAVA
jgi:hypothetical protein